MNKHEMENRLHELKVKQSDIFKKKKADRNTSELEAIREEMNKLKGEVKTAAKA
jgi:hypothetical protein